MADTGQPWSLRYPTLTDPPNGPVATQQLAEEVHGWLGYAYPCTSATRPTNKPGLIIYESDTDLLYVGDGSAWSLLSKGYDDTGWVDIVTAGWTPIGAYSIANGQVLRRNGFVSLYCTLVAPATLASGDYANQSVLQAPAGYIPVQANGGFNGGPNGSWQSGYIASNGIVVITAGGGMTATGSIQVTGTYGL